MGTLCSARDGHSVLHVMGTLCSARDLHTIVPGSLDITCWRQFAAQWEDRKKNLQLRRSMRLLILIIISAKGLIVGWLLNVPATG